MGTMSLSKGFVLGLVGFFVGVSLASAVEDRGRVREQMQGLSVQQIEGALGGRRGRVAAMPQTPPPRSQGRHGRKFPTTRKSSFKQATRPASGA